MAVAENNDEESTKLSGDFTGRVYLNTLCGFDRASSLICRNKMPTRCNR